MPRHLIENNPSLLWLKDIGMDFINLSYQYKDPFVILKNQEILFSNKSADTLFESALIHKTIDEITSSDCQYRDYFDYFETMSIDSTSLTEPIRFKWRHIKNGKTNFNAEILLFILKNDLYNNYYGAFILDLSRLDTPNKTTSDALYNLLTNSKEATLIINPQTGYILHANKVALEFYGYTSAQIHRLKISDINLLTPEAIQNEMARATAESRNHFNFRHKLSNSDIWDVKVISGPFEYNGEKLLFSTIEPINKVIDMAVEDMDYHKVFKNAPIPMVIMSNSLKILDANAAFEKHFLYSKAEILQQAISDAIVPSEFSEESFFFLNMVLEGNTIEYDVVRQNKNHMKKNYHMTAFPLASSNQGVTKFVAMYEEITEEVKSKHLYDLFLKTFDHITEGVIITRPDKKIIWANKAFLDLTGYDLDEIKNHTPKILKSGEHTSEFYQNMWLSINSNGFWSGEVKNRTKTGATLLEWLTILDVKNHTGQTLNYIGVIYDITNYKANEEKITNLAYYDHLTQLLARGHFLELSDKAIENAVEKDQKLCLYYLDVDFFKEINDQYGHSIGDLALISVALILKNIFDQDEMISRIGGDEFVVMSICKGKNLTEIHRNLKKIEDAFVRPLKLDDQIELTLSVSVGYAVFPKEGRSFDQLLHVADDRMYQLKASHHKS